LRLHAENPNMTLTFPHRFDTTTSLRRVVQLNAGIVVLVAAGLIYSVLVSRDVAAMLQLTVVGVMAVGAGRLVLGLAWGSSGTLTTDEVVVERPPVMFGLSTASAPSGWRRRAGRASISPESAVRPMCSSHEPRAATGTRRTSLPRR
jgi:hypothetical protein